MSSIHARPTLTFLTSKTLKQSRAKARNTRAFHLASLPNRPNHHFSFSLFFSELLGLSDLPAENLGGKRGSSAGSPAGVEVGRGRGVILKGLGSVEEEEAGGGVSVLGIIPARASGVLTSCGIDRLHPLLQLCSFQRETRQNDSLPTHSRHAILPTNNPQTFPAVHAPYRRGGRFGDGRGRM